MPEGRQCHIRRSRSAPTVGADLNKAICLRESGATLITIGRVTFAGEAFDQMIQKVTVTSVEQSGTSVERRIPEFNLQRLAAEVMQRHPERVLFTPQALRSFCECSYADIEQVKTCLSLMVTLIYDAYLAQGSMLTDLQQLKRAGIEFKPNSPEVPDKDYWDQQKYECLPVDAEPSLPSGERPRCESVHAHLLPVGQGRPTVGYSLCGWQLQIS